MCLPLATLTARLPPPFIHIASAAAAAAADTATADRSDADRPRLLVIYCIYCLPESIKRTQGSLYIALLRYIRCIVLYNESETNKTVNSCPQLPQKLTDFQFSFAGRLSDKFATKLCVNIPPHLEYVATQPCEISMFKKSPCSRSN